MRYLSYAVLLAVPAFVDLRFAAVMAFVLAGMHVLEAAAHRARQDQTTADKN